VKARIGSSVKLRRETGPLTQRLDANWGDWKIIFQRIKYTVTDDRVSIVASSMAFYCVLAIFPLLIAIVSIYGLFADPTVVERDLNSLAQMLPPQSSQILADQLRSIVQTSDAVLGWSVLLSIVGSLWSSSKASKALMEAFNIAYDEKEERGFIKQNLVALAITLGGAVFVIFAISLVAAVPIVLGELNLSGIAFGITQLARWLAIAFLSMLAIALVTRYAPSHRPPRWQWFSVGGVLATLLWLAASTGFSYYVTNFGNYNETYGSISGIIIMLLWFYITSFVLLLGAEINSSIEYTREFRLRRKMQMGIRGAVK
jgi:membrane protein